MVGVVNIADYLLFLLNRAGEFSYVDALGLSAPTDDVRRLLAETARASGMTKVINDLDTGTKREVADVDRVATHFVRLFRDGRIGKINLDWEDVADLAAGEEDNAATRR